MSAQGEHPIGEVVRDLRHKADLTQEDLAERAGVHTTWISKIESGRVDPKLTTVEGLAEGLDMPAGHLVALAERPKPKKQPGAG
jgi:transcriptional regulator with XRE-family HTH domain